MAENSKISWTDHTFNPWWGCAEASPACDNCYAREFDKRLGGDNLADFGRPARVFCASMADVFEVRPELTKHRERLFSLIRQTPNLLWNLL